MYTWEKETLTKRVKFLPSVNEAEFIDFIMHYIYAKDQKQLI